MPADSTQTLATQDAVAALEAMAPSEQEAVLLSESALLLDQSREDPARLAEALERNLHLWTAIRTFVSQWTDGTPQNIRDNLCRLADFVSGATIEHGTSMDAAMLDSLINVNLQISEGLLEGQAAGGTREPEASDLDTMTPWQQDAVLLSETAIMMDEARDDAARLAQVLNRNLGIWATIRAAVSQWDETMPTTTRDNLLRLSDYVCGTLLDDATEIAGSVLDAMININLQISEGLLEAHRNRQMLDKAQAIRDGRRKLAAQ